MDLTIEFNLAALIVVAIVIYAGYRLIKGDSDD
jgi:hypothetical protein